jgi:hypothetical protein
MISATNFESGFSACVLHSSRSRIAVEIATRALNKLQLAATAQGKHVLLPFDRTRDARKRGARCR